MPLTRPSIALSVKSNINPSVNRQTEATAEDFNEAGALLNEYATAIEDLQIDQSPNPFYGRFTSLGILLATFPVGIVNGWAIIDAGLGITPIIVAWDDIEGVWEATGASDIHVYVNTASQLPATGQSQKDYITLDDMLVRVWHNDSYKIKSPSVATASIETLNFTATANQTDFTITGAPADISMVFKGRSLALLTDDYIYSAGTLTFNEGLILGTKIKIIF